MCILTKTPIWKCHLVFHAQILLIFQIYTYICICRLQCIQRPLDVFSLHLYLYWIQMRRDRIRKVELVEADLRVILELGKECITFIRLFKLGQLFPYSLFPCNMDTFLLLKNLHESFEWFVLFTTWKIHRMFYIPLHISHSRIIWKIGEIGVVVAFRHSSPVLFTKIFFLRNWVVFPWKCNWKK